MADEGDALVAGGLCQTSLYKYHKDETRIKNLFRLQLEVFVRKNVDFLIAEVRLVLEELDRAALCPDLLHADDQRFRLIHCILGKALASACWVPCEAGVGPTACLDMGVVF